MALAPFHAHEGPPHGWLTPNPNPNPNQAEFLHRMLQRGTGYGDNDGLFPEIRELQRLPPRGHAAAAAVLAADPLDSNGVPRRQARAQRAAEQRWGQSQHQRNEAVQELRAAVQEQMGLQRVRERDAREAESEEPGAARLAGAESSCDPRSLGVDDV